MQQNERAYLCSEVPCGMDGNPTAITTGAEWAVAWFTKRLSDSRHNSAQGVRVVAASTAMATPHRHRNALAVPARPRLRGPGARC